jgi:formamidopyrimidine-DNA glycosylase
MVSGRYPRRRVKSLLLDQHVLAGIGNIYADEICFSAGILPDTPCVNADAARLLRP